MATIDMDTTQDVPARGTAHKLLLKGVYLACAALLGVFMMVDLIMIIGALSKLVAYNPHGTISASYVFGQLLLFAVAMNVMFWFRHRLKANVAQIDAE